MLLISCPYCGERPEVEFRYAGAAHIARPRDPSQIDDRQWAEYLYFRSNLKGIQFERWHHIHGCGRFFNAARDSATDKFTVTYKIGEKRPDPPVDGERIS